VHRAGRLFFPGWLFSGDKVDYRSGAAKTKALEVPPDLTQLSRESRYQLQGGVVSASGTGAAPRRRAAAAAGAATVALSSQGVVRVERQGQHRWLVVR
jgi:outer membrane protein assembly factor BamC